MSANNIYNIDNWNTGTYYPTNYIVQNSGLFYYSAYNQTSTSSFTNDLNNGNWNGYIWNNGQNKPYFVWRANYDFSNKNTPRVKTIQFGDGYFQAIPDGINNLLLDYSLTFEGDLPFVTSILHFLQARNGSESFCWIPPAPRGQLYRFICPTWTDAQPFYNHYKIEANFKQSPV